MIDPRLLREDPDRVREGQAKRGLSPDVVDQAIAADERRRSAIADFERLRAEQKSLGKQIPQAQGEEKQELLARTKTLSAAVKEAEQAQAEAEQAYRELLMSIPNVAAPEAPAGGEEVELRNRLRRMQEELDSAIHRENFERAAEIRDRMRELRGEETPGPQELGEER